MVSSDISVADAFREIMSNCAASVTVVTCRVDGRNHGLTVSAFTSVSLQPPLALVCIGEEAVSGEVLRRADGFTVNLLRAGSGPVADRFASPEEDRFAGSSIASPVTPGAGPFLPDHACAYLECRTVQSVEAGDHVIFIGQVENAVRLRDDPPLVHWRRAYARPVPED